MNYSKNGIGQTAGKIILSIILARRILSNLGK
jgi:hypothetical protein